MKARFGEDSCELSRCFSTDKYAVMRSLVREPTLSFVHDYVVQKAARPDVNRVDPDVPDTPSVYGDALIETLLEALRPGIEEVTSLRLYPTYAYFRVYKHGDVLKKHRDRYSCEVSLTLTLGYKADQPWPIWIEGANGVSCVSLNPGDATLYRGTECAHWREAFEGDYAAQAFLHYVDRNGPYAEWKFDKRERLNAFQNPAKRGLGLLLRGVPGFSPIK